MPSKPEAKKVKSEVKTAGEMRQLLVHAAIGLMHGDVDVTQALALASLARETNVSLYSEIKAAVLLQSLGKAAPELGDLPLFGRVTPAIAA